jgi:hypothetical protein
MAAPSISCTGGVRRKVKHYRAMCYGQLALSMHSFAARRECALHHIAGLNAEEVCYLHGASSLDSVSS